MRHKWIVITLLPLLCSGCTPGGLPLEERIPLTKNETYERPENTSYSDLDYADYSEKTTLTEVQNKITNGESFVLYLFSDGCHHCQQLKPLFLRYICETKYVFTVIEAYEDGNDLATYQSYFPSTFPEIFPFGFMFPSFYFVLDGTPVESVIGLTDRQLQEYQAFRSFLNGYVKDAS